MSRMDLTLKTVLLGLLGLAVASAPALAGSAVVGSLAGSLNTTVGGHAALPNTTLFSGDSIQVRVGVAVVALQRRGGLLLGRETVASFLHEAGELTVLLGRGNLSLVHPAGGAALVVKAGEITIRPAKDFPTQGEIAMANGSVVVTAREGALRVESQGQAVDVTKGKTITVNARGARAPQGQAGGVAPAAGGLSHLSTTTALSIGTIGANGLASGLAASAINRADSATSAANTATNNLSTAANAATQALSTSQAANATATDVGNAINVINSVLNPGTPSPFNP